MNKSIILNIATLLLFCLSANMLMAQKGTVRGILVDDETGEELIGASIAVAGTSTGTDSDIDGSYSLSLDPGSYDLEFSYVGYAIQTVTGVEVKADEVTALDIRMKVEGEALQEVVVEARVIQNTENALLTKQKKSVNVLDAISAAAITKSGDSDAGAAIGRVTGVTVEGGKHVFVRGLGDRYTKTILSGVEIPGLDPDRNTVQLDVFPTQVIDNISVFKTFTPDLSGDFTGGTVDISLRDFPYEKTMNVSYSLGFDAQASFNPNFVTYQSSAADIFGLGAGSRALPFTPDITTYIPMMGQTQLELNTKAFSREMSADRRMALLDQSLGFSLGNQINTDKRTFGYNVALGYKNSYDYYGEARFNDYLKDSDRSQYELLLSQANTAAIGEHETLWTGLLNGSVKRGNASHSLSLFHTQNGIKKASDIVSEDYIYSNAVLEKDILYYNQRSISNLIYDGRYVLPKKDLEFKLKLSPSISMNKEPDMRITAFSLDEEGTYTLNIGDGARVSRLYRDLQEVSANAKFDAQWKFNQWAGHESKLKGGVAYLWKMRDFFVLQYDFRQAGAIPPLTGNPDQLFEEGNLFDANTGLGLYANGQLQASDNYEANIGVAAAYLMNELPISKKFKAIYGLRVEQATMNYTGQQQNAYLPEHYYDNQQVLSELDFLPSANIIYNLTDDMNLRASYSRTLARPSFKEKSLAQIVDPITGITFIGNLDLEQTYINNVDARWEYFFNRGEMVSFSAFYKQFNNPIEIVAFSAAAPDNVTPRNVDEAMAVGVELELRKNLDFIHSGLKGLSFGTNVSYIHSQVSMNDAEYEARVNEARDGETINRNRVMQGQSPFIVNTYLNYTTEKGFSANASYNVQGERLSVVGIARVPDVYEQPFHNLSLKLGQRFGKDDKWKATLTGQNLLGSNRAHLYRSYNATAQEYRFLQNSMSISAGVSYSL